MEGHVERAKTTDFGLGAVLYAMCAGRSPLGRDAREMADRRFQTHCRRRWP
jgi:hypothetical protein